ncbi:MAG: CDP-archaeol synthase [Bacteroidota bacterium]
MSNLLQRALTGILFVASIVLSIWFNNYAAIAVFSLFFIGALVEYLNLFSNHEFIQIEKYSFLIFNFSFFALAIICLFFKLNFIFLFAIFPLLFLYMLLELWRKKPEPLVNIATGIFGFIYLLFPFSLILILLFVSTHSFPVLIGMFLLIWTNDTFAYFSGRFFGKTKLFERISPKKTWEGTIGGVIFTILVGFLIGLTNNSTNMIFWIVSAIIIAPTSIFGDLLESLFKRNLKIKDSGTILPGHGGILDRFDATIFTVPFYFLWWTIYQGL